MGGGGKRKSRGGGEGPTNSRKRKTATAAIPTRKEDSPPNSDIDEAQLEDIIKVQLDSESKRKKRMEGYGESPIKTRLKRRDAFERTEQSEPQIMEFIDPPIKVEPLEPQVDADEDNKQQEIFEDPGNQDLASTDPNIDISDVFLMRSPKVEPMVEDPGHDQETETPSIDIETGNGGNGHASLSTSEGMMSPTECENGTTATTIGGQRHAEAQDAETPSIDPDIEKSVDGAPSTSNSSGGRAGLTECEHGTGPTDGNGKENNEANSNFSSDSNGNPLLNKMAETGGASTAMEGENVGEDTTPATIGSQFLSEGTKAAYSSNSSYWKLKVDEMANENVELDKKARHLEAELAYWKGKADQKMELEEKARHLEADLAHWKGQANLKLESDQQARHLKVDLVYWKDKAEELGRKFLEVEREIPETGPIKLLASQSDAKGRPTITFQSTSSVSSVESGFSPNSSNSVIDESSEESEITDDDFSDVIKLRAGTKTTCTWKLNKWVHFPPCRHTHITWQEKSIVIDVDAGIKATTNPVISRLRLFLDEYKPSDDDRKKRDVRPGFACWSLYATPIVSGENRIIEYVIKVKEENEDDEEGISINTKLSCNVGGQINMLKANFIECRDSRLKKKWTKWTPARISSGATAASCPYYFKKPAILLRISITPMFKEDQ